MAESFRRHIAALLLGGTLLAAFGSASAETLSLEIKVDGPQSKKLTSDLTALSELERIKKEGAVSAGAVRRLATADVQRFTVALAAEGYYAAQVDPKVTEDDSGLHAAFTITPGDRFSVTGYEIRYTDAGPETRPTTPGAIGVDTSSSSVGSDILTVQSDVIKRLHQVGYPLAQVTERRAEAKLEEKTAKIVLITQSGPYATYGTVLWPTGIRTRRDYLQSFIPWKTGQRFNLDQTAQMRDDLAETGLFTVVAVEPGTPAPDGTTPVDVSLTERKLRTFGAGVSYSTNLGFGGQTSWLHRNLMGRGEQLELNADISQVLQSGKVQYKAPRIIPRTDLLIIGEIKNEDDDAFSGVTFDITGELHRKLRRYLTAKAGVELFVSQSEDTFGPQRSHLIGFPIGLTYNNIKNVLNPTSGVNSSVTVEPFIGESNGPASFTLIEGTASYHHRLDERARFIGAVWAHAGASIGETVSAVPPDKRYYAGGAGSVRGYGYKLLGPTDVENDPIGGRSVLEGGAELRFPVKGNFGGAVFLEGGNVSEQGLFTFDEGIRYGAGIGVRYYTAVGPIRADIAFPLDRRENIDDPFQFYISLGQAF
jgi:translocation and assembly module TamA